MQTLSVPLHQSVGMDVVAYGKSSHDPDTYYLIRAYDRNLTGGILQERHLEKRPPYRHHRTHCHQSEIGGPDERRGDRGATEKWRLILSQNLVANSPAQPFRGRVRDRGFVGNVPFKTREQGGLPNRGPGRAGPPHDVRPIRRATTRPSHSDSSSAAMAMAMATTTSRAACASPPGTCRKA